MQEQPLDRLAKGAATAFSVATLAVYPLYIDKFSNLGLTKFSGVFTLSVIFIVLIGACALVGAKGVPGRFIKGKKDYLTWTLAAFVITSALSTVISLSPASSMWGLGSYYGGLAMVLFTAAGYLLVRTLARQKDFTLITLCVGATVVLVSIFYTCNIFNIDLIGTYADTAVVERAQFFSTLVQKDFNAGYLTVALPIVFWAFLQAKGIKKTILFGIPAIFGTLALAVVDAEGLLLGVSAAIMLVICHRSFGEQQFRRMALLGTAFFCWAGWMHYMRATVYTQGGTSVLAEFGAPWLAIPAGLLCLAIWGGMAALAHHCRLAVAQGKEVKELPLYMLGRAVTAILLCAGIILFLLANFLPGFPSLGKLDGYFVFNDDWGTYRGVAWKATAGTWADASIGRQLFGYGPGMMHRAMMDWAGDGITARMKTFYAAHNEYLEQLLTTGIVGLAAWGSFAALHVRRGLKAWYSQPAAAPIVLALISYLVQAVVSIRVSMIFPEVMLLFALLAAYTAPQIAPLPDAAKPAPPAHKKSKKRQMNPAAATDPRRARLIYSAGVVVAAIAVMVVAAPLSHLLLWFLF